MNRAKEWLVRVGFTLAALAAGPPIVHFDNTQRVIQALLGQDVSCGDEIDPYDPQNPPDAIVVPGAGRLPTSEGTYEPTEYGKMRLEAAAILYERNRRVDDGPPPKIILLNGAGGVEEDSYTEVRFLQHEVQMLTGEDAGIPDEDILVDNASINTATNMRELARLAKLYGSRRVEIETNDFQLARAILFACFYGKNLGLSVTGVSAESVIVREHPERAREFAALYETDEIEAIIDKETAEKVLVIFDPWGDIPTWVRIALDASR